MSKAFTRESDFEELPELPLASAQLAPGEKNLMTAAGAERRRAELQRLVDEDRPPLATQADEDPETRGELRVLDQRIRQLRRSLNTAEIVAPTPGPHDVVCFGHTVTVRGPDGAEERFHIVGVDEIDLDGEAVSWQSPLARAILNARRGERVSFRAPSGVREFEIVAIE